VVCGVCFCGVVGGIGVVGVVVLEWMGDKS